MSALDVQVAYVSPIPPPAPAPIGVADEMGRDTPEPRWVRDLLVLQVTSIFAAVLFMAVWLAH